MKIFFTVIFFSLFVSCSKSDEIVDSNRVIKSISILLSDSSSVVVDFKYNSSQELIGISYGGVSHEIEYFDGRIVESIIRSGESTIENEHKINSLGYICEGSEVRRESIGGEAFLFKKTYALNYDVSGYLSSKSLSFYNNSDTPINTIANFERVDGEIEQEISVDGECNSTEKIIFSNTDYINATNLDLNTIITDVEDNLFGVCSVTKRMGKGNEKLLYTFSNLSQMSSGFWDETKYRFEYIMDTDNYPVEIKRYFKFTYSSLPDDCAPVEMLDMVYRISYSS